MCSIECQMMRCEMIYSVLQLMASLLAKDSVARMYSRFVLKQIIHF